MNEVEKIYVQMIDGIKSYILAKAEKISEGKYKIIEIDEYTPNDKNILFEFKPNDIVNVKEHEFTSSKSKGLLAYEYSDEQTQILDYNQFLFRILNSDIPSNEEIKEKYNEFIEKIKNELADGVWHYPGIKEWINALPDSH